MRIYTIYERAGSPPLFIAEAFSWSAALLQPIWALWHGGWRTALILFAAGVMFTLMRFLGFSPEIDTALIIIQAIAAGLLGPDLLRWDCSRRGYRLAAVIAAVNTDAARLLYHAMDRKSLVLNRHGQENQRDFQPMTP